MTDESTSSAPAAATAEAWYNKTWLVVLLLILVWPVGLVALGMNHTIAKSIKFGIFGCFALFVVFIIANAKVEQKQGAGEEGVTHPNQAAASSPITVTLDDLRADADLGFFTEEPNRTGVNQEGNHFHTWQQEVSIVKLITEGNTPRIIQINVVAMRVNDESQNAAQRVKTVFPGISLARRMIGVATNESRKQRIYTDEAFIWLGKNYDKEGATRSVGKVQVTVAGVEVKGGYTFTTFAIH